MAEVLSGIPSDKPCLSELKMLANFQLYDSAQNGGALSMSALQSVREKLYG